MLLKDKVAIISGSGGGIGRGAALRFAKEGARVAVCDIHVENGQNTVAQIKRDGGEAFFVKCDVSQEDEVENLYQETLRNFGTVDILVNNAHVRVGSGARGLPFLRMDAESWNTYMKANLGASFYMTHRAAKIMCAKRKGSIINVTTNATQRVHRRSIAYNAMKGAIEVFSMALAIDLAPWNVRVNVVRPGLIGTTGWEDIPEDVRARRASQVPLGRYGFAEDLAWAILFFASDEASYITGQGFQVDGGLLTQGRSPAGELHLPVVTPDNIDELFPLPPTGSA